MSEQLESPTTIRDRAVAVTDYLLAVRAQMERPARVVPSEAHWLDTLPDHPACDLGPSADVPSWLRVGLPELPPPVDVPPALRRRFPDATEPSKPEKSDPALVAPSAKTSRNFPVRRKPSPTRLSRQDARTAGGGRERARGQRAEGKGRWRRPEPRG